ncbi:unnamed protein product [Anisakis simplex]|uniref:CPG4 domain-containing protein n=1 Tax=Anisakis simplex TaxID=6269 RepID=A0A0M3KBM8_ANISI|nr:unnamed protein product [Anisakis simplex]
MEEQLHHYFQPIVVYLLITVFIGSVNLAPVDHIKGLTKLLKFSEENGCFDGCVTPFIKTIYGMSASANTRAQFANLCIEYTSTLSCFESDQHKCGANIGLFKVITSGLKVACGKQRSYFDSAFDCIDTFNDKPLQECERSCYLYWSLGNWTTSKYLNVVNGAGIDVLLMSLRDAEPVCSGLECFFSCARTNLNYMCGEDGERILDLFNIPLYELGRLYNESPIAFKTLLQNIGIPDECKRIDDALLIGEEFGVRNLDGSDSDRAGAATETHKRVVEQKSADYFDLSLVGIENGDLRDNGLQSHEARKSLAYIVLTMAFVAAVLLFTLIGLIVAILWCCITTARSSRRMSHALRFFATRTPTSSVRDSSANKSPPRFMPGTKEN